MKINLLAGCPASGPVIVAAWIGVTVMFAVRLNDGLILLAGGGFA